MQLEDLDELESRLDYQNTAVDGFPKLESLIVQIADVVEPSLARNHKSNKHRIWCSKHWKTIITRLETWRQQNKQLPVRFFTYNLSLNILMSVLCFCYVWVMV